MSPFPDKPDSSDHFECMMVPREWVNKAFPIGCPLAFIQNYVLNSLQAAMGGFLLLATGWVLIGCGSKEPGKPVDYSTSNEVRLAFGKVTRNYGLLQAKVDHDGVTAPARIRGMNSHLARAGAWNAGYVYFIVDPSFKSTNCHTVKVSVEYFDATQGYFEIQYDSNDPSAPGAGSYTTCPKQVPLKARQDSNIEEFVLTDVRFDNSQNGNADFRIHFKAKEFYLYGVIVSRMD